MRRWSPSLEENRCCIRKSMRLPLVWWHAKFRLPLYECAAPRETFRQVYTVAILLLSVSTSMVSRNAMMSWYAASTFDVAVQAIKAAKGAGFRVTTNTTVFEGENVEALRAFFDYASTLGVDGMMVSPGYS